jgi:hypothetical protein
MGIHAYKLINISHSRFIQDYGGKGKTLNSEFHLPAELSVNPL